MRPSEKLINDFQNTLSVQKHPNSNKIFSRKKTPLSKPGISSISSAYSRGKPEENALWSRFKNGSENAFTLIYNTHIGSLYSYGELYTSNKELIEDSIHDLFFDLWKNKSNLGTAFSIKFYLFKGLKRKILKALSLKRRLPPLPFSQDQHLENILSPEMNIVSGEISEEQKLSLSRAINKLSPRQKQAVIMRFYDNLSYKEIGDLLSINVKSTYTLIYRSIEVLRQNIEKVYSVGVCLGYILI